ncbi:hypothetical protein [Paenibacillus sp. N3.4]|uniref:hypothetical protein n=1 Tax=Paenibacillus sp. N3.4 TaxID=2603222 RepID=UPI0011C997C7|nr:hypothetical protein [Paenibacillus sp. N3.4]TXK76349.1 hypothetical protein FU659_25840 [Paenibacillus sp. N3.4]
MKKEDIITPAELHALLTDNGEELQEMEPDESIGEQHLILLQKAIVLLSSQVETLQAQLYEHFEAQNKQQELLLRQFKYQIEHNIEQQLIKGMEQQKLLETESPMEKQADEANSEETPAVLSCSTETEEPMTYSRVKSYGRIRQRKKSFIEKLFE